MLQSAEEFVLVLEAAEHRRRQQPGAQYFQGHVAPRTILLRFVHDAHRPLADLRDHEKWTDLRWMQCGRIPDEPGRLLAVGMHMSRNLNYKTRR